MTDTQWPCYEVFQQKKAGKPHQNVGSVHAPDAEMALLNGRNVFVRRPQCHSLWVVPQQMIYQKTAEALEEDPTWADDTPDPLASAETYVVFQKNSRRQGMVFVTHVGEVTARSPVEALQKALAQYDEGQTLVWWVCPQRAITASQEEDVDSWFAPAGQKLYRMPNQYHTVFAMQKIKRAEGETHET